MTPTARSDIEALRAAVERLVAAAFPGLSREVLVTSDHPSCATVRVFANCANQESVYWFQLFVRNPSVPGGVVRAILDEVERRG